MPKQRLVLLLIPLLWLPARAESREPDTYKSFSTDQAGRLHLQLSSGKNELAPMLKWQVGFADPQLSPDGRTIGWLAMCPFPRVKKTDYDPGPLACSLVLYRKGGILHQFKDVQTFWDWHFWRGGMEVAYSVGPTHGEASALFLCDVKSGRVIARWVPGNATPPDWTVGIRYQ